ncbi:type 2 DNA topoisomerase 6 subunit B-like [Scyliorhinus torazame]|uniref:type 2 DNA topoisomerase 6 subunit B-like n=1 Tax=Scyliorhinus torazame TaxID=75743 RepID=UPI003B5A4115
MESAVRQIIEHLIIHIKNDSRRLRRSAELEGDLLVLVNAVNPTLRFHGECLFCVVTVAAAGQWISKNQTDHFYKVIEKLLLQLSLRVVQTDMESADLNEKINSPGLKMTFEISETSRIVMTDCLTIERFLHRIGIVYPQVKIQFYVKVNGNLSTHIFGNENLDKFCRDGHTVLCDSTHYVTDFAYADDSRCCRLHPIAGKPFPLSIPNKLAEDGVCGVLEILSIAAICPCLKNYPNKPTRVSNVYIFIYGPSDLPILFKHSKNALSFFMDPSHLADWKQYEQHLTQNPDFKTVEGKFIFVYQNLISYGG